MNRFLSKSLVGLCTVLAVASLGLAQDAKKEAPKGGDKPAAAGEKKDGGMSAEVQKQMAEMMAANMKTNEHHAMLKESVGEWTYVCKSTCMGEKPTESTGTMTAKMLFDGRYLQEEVSGKMQMPNEKGEMTDFDFKGISTTGYDNAKKKFVNHWIDNGSTGFYTSEGTYDAATKTITYNGEWTMIPDHPSKVRMTVKFPDKNTRIMEMFETNDGGPEQKTMEITYKRKMQG